MAAAAAGLTFTQIELAPAAVILVLLVAVTNVLWWRDLGKTNVGRFAVFVASVSCAVLLPDSWWSLVPFVALATIRALRVDSWKRCSSLGLAAGLSLAALGLVIESSGLVWQELSAFSWALTALVTASTRGAEAHLGPAVIPLVPILIAASIWLCQMVVGRVRLLWHLRTLIVLSIGAILAISFNQQLLGALLAGFAAAAVRWRDSTVPQGASATRQRAWLLGIGVCLPAVGIGVLLLASAGRAETAQRPKVFGLLDAGMRSVSHLGRDDLTVKDNGANFAVFMDLLRISGWEVRDIPIEATPTDLDGVGVLCAINLNRSLSIEARSMIERFVRDGGRLLVLTDHTDIGGVMGPTNELLEFTGIRARFDSAIPIDSPSWKWRSCLRASWHPAFTGRTNQSFGIGVGASLDVSGEARVLVLGDRGFSDWGNPDFGISRLGDMSYNLGERNGGLPLVAQEPVGRGVVEVWGDTTGFQSTVLAATHEARLTAVRDLLERTPSVLFPRRVAAVFVILAALTGALLLARSPLWLVTALLMSVCIGSFGTRTFAVSDEPTRAGLGLPIVAFDASHGPLYPGIESSTWLSGFADLTRRCGSVFLHYKSIDDMLDARPAMVAISEPTAPYSQPDAEKVLRYVRDGGHAIVAAGPGSNRTLSHLLAPLGLSIGEQTMGVAHRARLVHGRNGVTGERASELQQPSSSDELSRVAHVEPEEVFAAYDAEIAFKEAFPIVSSGAGEHEVLIECWGAPIAVRCVIGRGSLILIGDAQFFTDAVTHRGPVSNQVLEERNARFFADHLAR